MRLPRRRNDHAWSQAHLSHYVEGDLTRRGRLRLELHAEDCPDCSRGLRAMRALLRLAGSMNRHVQAPAGIFGRVREDARASKPQPEDGVAPCSS